MKSGLLISFSLLSLLSLVRGQDNWMIFNAADRVSHIYAGDGEIWVNSASGLSAVLTNDLEVTRFNTLNSPIFFHTPDILGVDAGGRLWLKGDSSLLRFDGVDLEIIEQVNGLPVIEVNAAATGPDGKLWLLGKFGDKRLLVWENGIFTPIPAPDSLNYFNVTADLAVDAQGHVWTVMVGSNIQISYLFEFDGADWIYHDLTAWQTATPFKNTYIADKLGNVYSYLRDPVDSNLIRWDGAQWVKLNIPLEASFRGLYTGPDNNLWVMETNETLLKWDGQNWQVTNLQDIGLPDGRPLDMEVDEEGKLWIVYQPYYTTGLGTFLYVRNDGVFEKIDLSNSGLHSNAVQGIAIDALQRKWIDTGLGLQMFDGIDWTYFGLPDFSSTFSGLVAAGDGTIWARIWSTNAAISRFNGTSFEKIVIPDENGNPYEAVWDLSLDETGQPLVAVNQPVVIRLAESGFEYLDSVTFIYPNTNWVMNDLVKEVAGGKNGVVWALGSFLHRYDGGWETIPYWDNSYNSTHGLFVDDAGAVYLKNGLSDTLYRFDDSNWSMTPMPEECSGCEIAFDSEGNLWAAQFGLWKYTGLGSWEKYDIYNSPLPSDYISDLKFDAFDNLWLATQVGLVIFNENGIENISTVPVFERKEKTLTLQIVPNPANEHLTISAKESFGRYQLWITDVWGRMVLKQRGWADGAIPVQVKDIVPGVYFIRLVTDKGMANSQVILK